MVRINHRVTTPADPDEVWAVLENPSRWPEFDLFLHRVEGTRGLVREGQHLMATARGIPMRVPVDVRLVARSRHLGLTIHTLPGLREQLDASVTGRRKGGSEIRCTTVLEGPMAPVAVLPIWVSSAVTTWMLGLRATREHRRARSRTGVGDQSGAA